MHDFVDSSVPDGTAFDIPPMSDECVLSVLRALNPKKATGLDGVSARLLKESAGEIAPSLIKVFNLSISISTDEFPSQWKLPKVVPIHKGGSLVDVNNFRPISILPVMSKILERHVHDAIYTYLTVNNVLSSNQSGFRPMHSCQTALTKMVYTWLNAINDNLLVGVVLIDLRNVFDLVNHTALLETLRCYKCNVPTVNWFASYLQSRSQTVVFDGCMSEQLPIGIGVPQGSILGPLLFIAFINDLPLYTERATIDMYADDSSLQYAV
jgi:hypothetical protein